MAMAWLAYMAESLAVIVCFWVSFMVPGAVIYGFHPPETWFGALVCSLMVACLALRGDDDAVIARNQALRPWRLASAWLQCVGAALFMLFASLLLTDSSLHKSLEQRDFAGTDPAGLIIWAFTFLAVSYVAVISVRLLGRTSCAVLSEPCRLVVIGRGACCSGFIDDLRKTLPRSLEIVGFVDYEEGCPISDLVVTGRHGSSTLGQTRELVGVIQRGELDAVIAVPTGLKAEEIREVLALAQCGGVDVLFAPFLDSFEMPLAPSGELGGVPLLRASYPPIFGWQLPLKRVQDLVLSSLLILFGLPAIAAIAAMVKLTSPGPIFFRQPRVGYGGKVFEALKFRTMYAHLSDARGVAQTSRGDRRITPIGGWLRRRSLDELPQLFNVLRGDMSLVGPRPHAIGTTVDGVPLDEAVPAYCLRQRVRPGLTGWAQVNGSRGPLRTFEEIRNRVRLDLEYVRNWSLTYDWRIVCRTVRLLLTDKNAF